MPVLTFSRYFPAKHPKKGQPTFFVEQIWKSLIKTKLQQELWMGYISPYQNMFGKLPDFDSVGTKHHTIRAGNRWKAGDKFSPRVWSGKPYASKQITIAPDIEIKKVMTFEMNLMSRPFFRVDGIGLSTTRVEELAMNDGLSLNDLKDWFCCNQPIIHSGFFKGQIICWNESIDYCPVEY